VLIVSGVPPQVELESLASASEVSFASASTATISTSLEEQHYNMDPTSIVGVGMIRLHDEADQAFEFFCRAWLMDQHPIAVMKLVTVYLPLHATPQRSAIVESEQEYPRYLRRVGGTTGLAKLYREAGIIFMQGLGTTLSGSMSTLSNSPFALGSSEIGQPGNPESETAQRYFRRARALDPTLLMPDVNVRTAAEEISLVMPSVDVSGSAVTEKDGMSKSRRLEERRRRRQREEQEDWSNIFVPGLVGAGLAIGIVGLVSASNWWRGSNR